MDARSMSLATTQRSIRALNLQAIGCWAGAPTAWSPTGVELHSLRVDSGARIRLASVPFLLIDLAFDDADRWSHLIQHGVSTSMPPSSIKTGGRPQVVVRQVLVLLWHLAQLRDRISARLIDPNLRTAKQLAGIDVCALEGLNGPATELLSARWAHRREYWQALIDAACFAKHAQLEHLALIGLQMLGVSTHTRFFA